MFWTIVGAIIFVTVVLPIALHFILKILQLFTNRRKAQSTHKEVNTVSKRKSRPFTLVQTEAETDF